MRAALGTLALAAVSLAATAAATDRAAPPKTGYVVHFDFLKNAGEGRDLVRIAQRAGARVINLVPPAHVWENPAALAMLDAILDEIARRRLSLIFTRIDAAYPPDARGRRYYYLYSRILTEPGLMPNGQETNAYFRTTAGLESYAAWMEEETRYYARRFAVRLQFQFRESPPIPGASPSNQRLGQAGTNPYPQEVQCNRCANSGGCSLHVSGRYWHWCRHVGVVRTPPTREAETTLGTQESTTASSTSSPIPTPIRSWIGKCDTARTRTA